MSETKPGAHPPQRRETAQEPDRKPAHPEIMISLGAVNSSIGQIMAEQKAQRGQLIGLTVMVALLGVMIYVASKAKAAPPL